MSERPFPNDPPPPGSDIFDLLRDDTADQFSHISLDLDFKEDLFELVGLAIKEAMRLREGFPVRLTASNPLLAAAQIGRGTMLDQYLVETNALIEEHFARIADRISLHLKQQAR